MMMMTTTTMKKSMTRVALATAMLTTGATGATADANPAPATTSVEVRVINNYVAPVRVFLRDATGRAHDMGWVGRSDVRILQVAQAIADLGAFQINVVPDVPIWSSLNSDEGIRTNGLTLAPGEALNFWVETNLADSKVELVKG